jgi:hypothetical protein
MLFAWHAHALPYASSDASSIAGAPRTGDRTSTTIDLDCQICFAFCHYSAAPVDFIFSVPPDYESFSSRVIVSASVSLASYLLFLSRAPPRI